MDIGSAVQAIIYGIIEGLTEFLPISSTGHLILAERWVGFLGGNEAFTNDFIIIIQLGAILAVAVYFRKELYEITKGFAARGGNKHPALGLCLAVLPIAVLGLLFRSTIKEHFFSSELVAAALIAGGIAIFIIWRVTKRDRITSWADVTYRTAILIGLFQALSLVPGVSRAGATIMGGFLLGMSVTAAVEYSFLLSILTMTAATGYEVAQMAAGDGAANMPDGAIAMLIVGFAVSFLVALGVVAFLMRFIKKHSFDIFAYYRVALGAAILLLLFLRR